LASLGNGRARRKRLSCTACERDDACAALKVKGCDARWTKQHSSLSARALLSLEGLSVGDAFGGALFFTHPGDVAICLIGERAIPRRRRGAIPDDHADGTFRSSRSYARHGEIDPELRSPKSFGRHYDPHAAATALPCTGCWPQIRSRISWRKGRAARASSAAKASFGNGSAMRVAPLGAYFAGEN